MTVPTWAILIPYAVYVVLFAALTLVDFYHMVRFGTFGVANVIAAFAFLAGTAYIFFWTAQFLAPVDWSASLGSVSGSIGDLFGQNL